CGALAGPVVAAAVVLGTVQIDGLTDSKCISAAKRTHLCGVIMDRVPCYAIASASRAEIDRLNILQARLLAMKRALQALQLPADMHILVDGTHLPDLDRPASAIIKGDLTVPAISAASIVAKVYRDWLMNKLHGRFPHYQFAAHKGYPTRAHRLAIAEHGLCTAHRRSFAPCHQPPPQRPPNSPTSAANTLPEMAVTNASPASANPRRPASAKNASPATAKNATRTAGADNTPRAVAVANARPARARTRRPASTKNASPATTKNASCTAGAENTPRAVATASARQASARPASANPRRPASTKNASRTASATNTLRAVATASARPASANPRRPASTKNASPATAKNATRTAGADNTPRAVAVANARPARTRTRTRRAGAVTVSGV
nr:ribonuclease HII [Pseudomonadota bacterium]